MPIYAYRCASCGFEKDHLQKLGEPVFEICPHCGQATYRKQLTAAGFQLKGTGWYATDFKGGTPASAGESDGKAGTKPADGDGGGKSAEVAKSTESATRAATSGATACGGN